MNKSILPTLLSALFCMFFAATVSAEQLSLTELEAKADQAIADNNPRKANIYYQRILRLDSAHEGALLGLLALYSERNDAQGMTEISEKLLSTNPQHIGALLVKGRLLVQASQWDQAKTYLNKVVQANASTETTTEAKMLLSIVYDSLGDSLVAEAIRSELMAQD